MTDNFLAVAEAHSLTREEIRQFSLNAIAASFIGEPEKRWLETIVRNHANQEE